MRRPPITKEEFRSALAESNNYLELSEKIGRSKGTISSYFKKFNIAVPPGFYSVGSRKWTEERKKKMSERMSGENNPFYSKKHSYKTKKQMRLNHADFTGDKNPFKKAYEKDPSILENLSKNKIDYWAEISTEKRYQLNKKVICGDMSQYHWTRLLSNAKVRGIEVLIEPQDAWNKFLEQDSKCALSGVELNLKSIYEVTASLDRVDSTKPYTKDNIQWIHKTINIMKGSLTQDTFLDICKSIAIYNA